MALLPQRAAPILRSTPLPWPDDLDWGCDVEADATWISGMNHLALDTSSPTWLAELRGRCRQEAQAPTFHGREPSGDWPRAAGATPEAALGAGAAALGSGGDASASRIVSSWLDRDGGVVSSE